MNDYISDIAFTPSVKDEQEKHGSRKGYQKMAEKRDWQNTISDDLKSFIAERDSIYIATSNKDGQPLPTGLLDSLREYEHCYWIPAGSYLATSDHASLPTAVEVVGGAE